MSANERERIARDLHDELGQLLGFLTTMVQAIQELVAPGDTSRAERELSRLETACRALGEGNAARARGGFRRSGRLEDLAALRALSAF